MDTFFLILLVIGLVAGVILLDRRAKARRSAAGEPSRTVNVADELRGGVSRLDQWITERSGSTAAPTGGAPNGQPSRTGIPRSGLGQTGTTLYEAWISEETTRIDLHFENKLEQIGSEPVRTAYSALQRAVAQLVMLRDAANRAKEVGVPPDITGDSMISTQNETAALLFARADRIAAIDEFNVDSPRVRERLGREVEKLDQIGAALAEAREALAIATLTGGAAPSEWEAVKRGFQRVSLITSAMEELEAEGL